MISTEAARESGKSKLQTRFSQNRYSKVTKFIAEFRRHRLCREHPREELLRKLWFDAHGL